MTKQKFTELDLQRQRFLIETRHEIARRRMIIVVVSLWMLAGGLIYHLFSR